MTYYKGVLETMQWASKHGFLATGTDVTSKDENVIVGIVNPNKSRLDLRKSNVRLIAGENVMWFVKDLHTFQLTYGMFQSSGHGTWRGPQHHTSHA